MIPMNNLIFGWNQIDYIQFSTLLQLAIFDTTFVFFFVFDEICGHISIYMKFNISPIQTQMEGPLILEPNIFQICWTIKSRFCPIYSQFTFNLLSNSFFTCNLLAIYFQTRFCDQPSLIWFLNISISIPQLNHFVCCYFINLSKINVCRRILLAPLDIETQNWPHFSVSAFSHLVFHCQRSWLSSWQHVVTIRRDQIDII